MIINKKEKLIYNTTAHKVPPLPDSQWYLLCRDQCQFLSNCAPTPPLTQY